MTYPERLAMIYPSEGDDKRNFERGYDEGFQRGLHEGYGTFVKEIAAARAMRPIQYIMQRAALCPNCGTKIPLSIEQIKEP